MTRTAARMEIARSILRRQVLGPEAGDATCLAWMRAMGLPALVRYDDGSLVPTPEAGVDLVDALLAGSAEVVHAAA